MNLAQSILTLALRMYQALLSPVLTAIFGPLGFGCRFHPTCSRYAIEAIQRHGAIRGSMLAAGRLCRCHPWGASGPDPVPEKEFKAQHAGRGSAGFIPQEHPQFTPVPLCPEPSRQRASLRTEVRAPARSS